MPVVCNASDAIRGLAVAGGAAAHAASIRKYIAAGENEVRVAAIAALAADAASKPAVAAILADRNQPETVRSAAIRNLTAGSSEATGPLIVPLMLFHQIQLMVCAVMSRRYAAGFEAELAAVPEQA